MHGFNRFIGMLGFLPPDTRHVLLGLPVEDSGFSDLEIKQKRAIFENMFTNLRVQILSLSFIRFQKYLNRVSEFEPSGSGSGSGSGNSSGSGNGRGRSRGSGSGSNRFYPQDV